MKLINRTVLITGGTSGIGLELARQLLQRKNTVLITGRDQARLDAAARALPGLHTLRSDVSEPEAIAALAKTALARFPLLDTLVNNAGVMRNLQLDQSRELGDLTREIEINLMGPMRMVQQFLPHLLNQPNALIVNVSSGVAFIPLPLSPIYCAAKAGVHSYTQSLRAQLKGTGVTVVELAPPGVDTPAYRADVADNPGGPKPMPVDTLARKAIAGIETGKLEIRPGIANVLMAMSRIAPAFALGQVTRMTTPK